MKSNELSDRRKNVTLARSEMLEKFKKTQAESAEGLAERLAARAEVARAREERQALRDAEKAVEKQRLAIEAAELAEELYKNSEEALAAAAKEADRLAQEKRIALVLSDDAARKTARDLRYAKRKAGRLAS